MSNNCCNDPTEPSKVDPRELLREKDHYGNLLRDLFTEDPEKVILKQLNSANKYLRELAALRAQHESVRKHAIELLDKESISILERIIQQEPNSTISHEAQQRLDQISAHENDLLSKFIKKLTD